MKKIERRIIKVGSSAGIIINNVMLQTTELELGDVVEAKCSKNRVVLQKKVEEKE